MVSLLERNMAQLPEGGGRLPSHTRIGGRSRAGKRARVAQPALEERACEGVVGLLQREVGESLQGNGQALCIVEVVRDANSLFEAGASSREIPLKHRQPARCPQRFGVQDCPLRARAWTQRKARQQRFESTASLRQLTAHGPKPPEAHAQSEAGLGITMLLAPIQCRAAVGLIALKTLDEDILRDVLQSGLELFDNTQVVQGVAAPYGGGLAARL